MPGHQRRARRDVGRSHGPARGPRRTAQCARYDHLGRQERVSENHALALGTGGHTGTLMVDRFLQKTDFVLGVGTSFTISVFNAPMPRSRCLGTGDQLRGGSQQGLPDRTWGPSAMPRIVLEQIIEEVRRQLGGRRARGRRSCGRDCGPSALSSTPHGHRDSARTRCR